MPFTLSLSRNADGSVRTSSQYSSSCVELHLRATESDGLRCLHGAAGMNLEASEMWKCSPSGEI